jgi:hypothetical protein
MARRRIFTVQTPLGHSVFLSRDRRRQIVRFKHPALAGREKQVQACLEQPVLARESAGGSDVHLYDGNTMSVWFDDPKKEAVCEETDDDVVLVKDRVGHIIGFERLNYLSAKQRQAGVSIPVEVRMG